MMFSFLIDFRLEKMVMLLRLIIIPLQWYSLVVLIIIVSKNILGSERLINGKSFRKYEKGANKIDRINICKG